MVVVLIIAVLTIPISAFAATLKRGNDFWYSTGNVSGETFAVDGNTAYCVNPLQPIPGNGNYTPTQLNNGLTIPSRQRWTATTTIKTST